MASLFLILKYLTVSCCQTLHKNGSCAVFDISFIFYSDGDSFVATTKLKFPEIVFGL